MTLPRSEEYQGGGGEKKMSGWPYLGLQDHRANFAREDLPLLQISVSAQTAKELSFDLFDVDVAFGCRRMCLMDIGDVVGQQDAAAEAFSAYFAVECGWWRRRGFLVF